MEPAEKHNLAFEEISQDSYVKNGLISHFEQASGQQLLDDTYVLKDSDNVLYENPYTAEFVVDFKDLSDPFRFNNITFTKGCYPRYPFPIRPKTAICSGAYALSPYLPDIPFETGHRYFVSVVCDGKSQCAFKDGKIWMKIARSNYNFTTGHDMTCSLVQYDMTLVDVHCLRVYSRPLSEDEVMKNWEVDKERFGI